MDQSAWMALQESAQAALTQPGTSDRETIARYDGLGFLKALISGELPYPPIIETLNFILLEVEKGRAVVQGVPLFAHYNPIGSVHGGWYCTLLDTALACAVHSTLPRGKGYTTLELKVNMIRPITDKTGPVRAEGRIIHTGNQTAISEGSLFDSNGKLYASATTT
ncbi:MAG TPA: PaaI family thioesterase, partial [Magnetospirillaceae bacterium]|nr:PaaI family thioesterase [Magnetospirillaceae bacterium]